MSRNEKQKKGAEATVECKATKAKIKAKVITSIIVAIVLTFALSGNGVNAYISTMRTLTNKFTIQLQGKVTIHHYEQGTSNPVAQDEEFEGNPGESFEVTNLISSENKISIGGTELDIEREYLPSNGYQYASVTIDPQGNATSDAQGVVTGQFTSTDIEITYYYTVEKYRIDGRVLGLNGTMTNIREDVISGDHSTKDIVFTPSPGYRVEKIIVYSGDEVDGTYGQESDGGIEITDFDENPRTLVATMDKFTNVTEDKYVAVKFEPRPYVAQIIAVPSDTENLTSGVNTFSGEKILQHRYYTLTDAINDAALANETTSEEDKLVEIILLDNIRNESINITNENNVSIDLKGFTINSNSSASPTLAVTESTLIVKDSNVFETGKVVSRNGVGIWIALDGELTLGVDEAPVSTLCPQVIGKTYGIFKQQNITDETDPETGELIVEEGIFKFFDGRITGFSTGEYPEGLTIVAINGRVDETPALMKTHTDTGENNEKIAYLVKRSDVEALIGKKPYSKVEDAIEAANNIYGINGETVEIDMVTDAVVGDISGKETMTIDANRNIVLDLNGKTITSEVSNNMFTNNGTFTIKDSEAEGYDVQLNTISTYYFEEDNCKLISNNKTNTNSTAYGIIPIDLTGETGNVTVTVNAELNTTSTGDVGWGIITTDRQQTTQDSTGMLFKINTQSSADYYSTSLVGGKMYYLHLGFHQDYVVTSEEDALTINSITVGTDEIKVGASHKKGSLIKTTGNVIVNNASSNLIINSGYIASTSQWEDYPVLNNGTLTINGGFIQNTYNNTYCPSVYNSANCSTTINGGTIYAYSVPFSNAGQLTMNDGVIVSTLANSNWGYTLYNHTNGTAVINNGYLKGYFGLWNENYTGVVTVNNIDINATSVGIVNAGNTVEINNTNSNTTVSNSGTVIIRGGKFSNINNSGTATITGGTISGYEGQIINNGTMTIAGTSQNKVIITQISPYYYSSGHSISNGRNASMTISNCEITCLENGNHGFYLISNNGGGIYLGEGVVANSIGGNVIYNVDNYNEGDGITIAHGTYTGNNHVIYNVSGKMNIGIENTGTETEVSKTDPTLRGNIYGVKIDSGEVNFYDGQIIASVGNTLQGGFTNIEEEDSDGNYLEIKISQITDNNQQYDRLILDVMDAPVAQISDSSILDFGNLEQNKYTHENGYYYFYKLSDAVSVCNQNAGNTITTIELINNGTTNETDKQLLINYATEIQSGQNIKINLNGVKISYVGGTPIFTNNGKLTIEDTTSRATVLTNTTFVSNTGTLQIDGGTINATYATIINNTGDVTINGGTINGYAVRIGTSNNYNTSINIRNTGSASCIINNGTLYNDRGTTISNEGTSTIEIVGGTFNKENGGYHISNSSTSHYIENEMAPAVYITGGTFGAAGIYDYNSTYGNSSSGADIWIIGDTNSAISIPGALQINNSNILVENAEISIYQLYGTTNIIRNSEISGGEGYIYSSASFTDCEITESSLYFYGSANNLIEGSTVSSYIYNNNTGTLTIDDSTVTNHVINAGSGTILIKGETSISKDNAGAGAVQNYTGTITIGVEGGDVNEQYPHIKNTTGYGLANSSGTIEFYDGKIEGKTGTIYYGSITVVEEGYSPKEIDGTLETTKAVVLRRDALYRVAKSKVDTNNLVEGQYTDIDADYYGFLTLEKAAIACACSNGEVATIELLGNVSYTSSAPQETIPAGKKLILDLCGNSINSGKTGLFTNNAELEIVDSSQNSTGTITVNAQNFIINTGTLDVTSINVIANQQNFISNSGITNISNGTIQVNCNGDNRSAISNTGTLTINGGTYYGNTNHNSNSPAYTTTMLVNNSGTAQIENITITGISIYNANPGNIEVINATGSESCMFNYSSKEHISGTSESAFKLLGGTFDGYCSINNNAGEFILDESANQSLIWNGNTNWMHGSINNNGGKLIINNMTLPNEYINLNSGTTEINNSTLNSCIITNNETSTLKINTGRITKTNSSESINNAGTIYIGENNVTVDDGTNIAITGYITSKGTVYYYDGTISAEGIPVRGTISSIPTDYAIINTISGTTQTYSLKDNELVAKIKENGEYTNDNYYTLEDAFEACTTGSNKEIVLQKNIAIAGTNVITIESGKDITLDLNGKQIIASETSELFENAGTFELKDTVGNAKIISYGNGIITNSGELTILGGDYSFGIINSSTYNDKNIIVNEGTGNVEITGGTFTTGNNVTAYCVLSSGTGDITISGGTFNCGPGYSGQASNARPSVIKVTNNNSSNKANISVSGNTVFNSNKAYTKAFELQNADLQVSGGTIGNGLENNIVNGDVTLTGGTISGSTIIDVNSTIEIDGTASAGEIDNYGTLTMNAGTVTGQVINRNSATFNGGEINTSATYALRNVSTGVATLNNGFSITHTASNSSCYGIYIESGTVNIYDGVTITSNSTAISNGGTLTVGVKARPVSTTSPVITGALYGIINSGTFNFYDGVITGTGSRALNGTEPADRPEGFEVATKNNGTVAYLEATSTQPDSVIVGGINYPTIELAIDSITTAGKLTICQDFTLSNSITIPSGKNITIDFNGCRVEYNSASAVFINNGTLSIIDTAENGTGNPETDYAIIKNETGVGIENHGTLTIGVGGNSTVYTNSPRIQGRTYAIDTTSGTAFNFYDGVLKGATAAVNGTITATPSGYTEANSTEPINGVTYYVKTLE